MSLFHVEEAGKISKLRTENFAFFFTKLAKFGFAHASNACLSGIHGKSGARLRGGAKDSHPPPLYAKAEI